MLNAKALLCLAGALGGCCAIGAPVAVNLGNGNLNRKAKIVKCDSTESKELVSFKDQTQSELCYKLVSSDSEEQRDESENSELPSELLTLLSDAGFTENDNGVRNNREDYSIECMKGSSNGKISSTGSDDIVGSCRNENVGKDQSDVFLEVPNNRSSSINLQVCLSGKECWTDDIKPDSITSYTSKSSTFGKTLNFYRK